MSNKFGIKAQLGEKRQTSTGNDFSTLYLKAADGTKFFNLISPIIKDANIESMLYKTRRHQEKPSNGDAK